jgi:hypothetical protein
VAENVICELGAGKPSPAYGRVHHLDSAASMAAPGNYKMREPRGQLDDNNGWEGFRFGQQKVIDREHHLLRFEPELTGDRLHGVDGCPVDAGLAGLA